MSPEIVAAIINSQNVLSGLAVVVVLGFGLFVDRRVWPWWVTFSEQWRQDSVNFKQRALDVQEKNDARWYRMSDRFVQEMQTTAVTLTMVRKTAEDVLRQVSGLREQLDDLEGVIWKDAPESPRS